MAGPQRVVGRDDGFTGGAVAALWEALEGAGSGGGSRGRWDLGLGPPLPLVRAGLWSWWKVTSWARREIAESWRSRGRVSPETAAPGTGHALLESKPETHGALERRGLNVRPRQGCCGVLGGAALPGPGRPSGGEGAGQGDKEFCKGPPVSCECLRQDEVARSPGRTRGCSARRQGAASTATRGGMHRPRRRGTRPPLLPLLAALLLAARGAAAQGKRLPRPGSTVCPPELCAGRAPRWSRIPAFGRRLHGPLEGGHPGLALRLG